MSKGHGRVQRRLLEILNSEDRVCETFALTALVFEALPGPEGATLLTAAQVVATRRALRKLADDRRIFDMGYLGRRKVWASERVGLPLKFAEMQRENLAIATSDPSRAAENMRTRLEEMQPLRARAEELGVNLT